MPPSLLEGAFLFLIFYGDSRPSKFAKQMEMEHGFLRILYSNLLKKWEIDREFHNLRGRTNKNALQ